jgi:hypothetical protein
MAFPQSADAVRTGPIPAVTDEDRRTNGDDDARTRRGVDQRASSDDGTDRNPAFHDVLPFLDLIRASRLFQEF